MAFAVLAAFSLACLSVLHPTECNACTCVTGATCDPLSGDCTCSLPNGFVCDKNNLTVSLTASQTGSITDTADAQQQVTLTCTINIPEADAAVTIPRISNIPLTSTGSNGEYIIMLNDVHPGDSGVYRCDVTTTINGVSTVTSSNDYTLDVNCADDYYGPSCTQRCNCVTGGMCNQASGVCNCTKPFATAVCDKDDLTVSLTASQTGSITDTADAQQQVTLTCTINIPEADATVTIPRISNTPLTSTGSNGEYTIMLNDVHPGDSGVYSCDVTTTINGVSTVTNSNNYTLDVNCADDFHGPSCTQRCNCVTGGMCNQASGVCDCTKPFATAVCDKDLLTVSLTSNQGNTVIDSSPGQQSVSLTCNVNLPDNDVTVVMTKLPSGQTISFATATNGVYRVDLVDVHPASSGTYRCTATRDINTAPMNLTDDYSLTVNCASDFYGPICDQPCNCVTGGTCNQNDGLCNCTEAFTGAVCDKDALAVLSVTSNPPSTVPDTSSMDNVTIQCRTNLPVTDVRVALTYPGSDTQIDMMHRMEGLYEQILTDVHESDSGEYTCIASVKPVDLAISKSGTYQLDIQDVDECTNPQYPHNCNQDATCNNIKGGFMCQCNAGYEGTGVGNTGCTVCTPGVHYGFNCQESCTCVTPAPGQNDVTCDNVDGTCTCSVTEFSGKTCDKRDLTVTLMPDPNPVLNRPGIDNITWRCMVNLHSRDLVLPVTITYPNGRVWPMNMSKEGLYERIQSGVTQNNNGRYTCTAAAVGMDPVTGHFDLDVLIDGGIISVSDPVEGEVGDTVRINCTVYARSNVDIAWYFGNNQIIDDAKYAITNMSLGDFEQISYLTVHNLIATDNGSYVCSATDDTRGALIVLIERPVISTVQVSAVRFDQLRVSWVISFDGNLPPPSCHVNYSSTSTGPIMSSPGSPVTDVSHIVTGLQAFTEYYVLVQCTNKVGSSDILLGGPQRTLKTNPSEPRNLDATGIQPDRFNVMWNEPAMTNGPIDGYKIKVTRQSDGAIIKMAQVTGRSLPVEGLAAYTEYTVVVIAFNTEGGQDLASNPTQRIFITSQEIPSRPLNVASQELGNSCIVSWDRPEFENGIIQSYTVYYTAYPRPGTGLSAQAESQNSGAKIIDSSQESYSFNKTDLASFTDFRFKVSATTIATGENSTEAVGSCTTNAAVPAKPMVPVLATDVNNPLTANTFKMRLATVSQRSGPISCFEVTVIQLNNNDVIDDRDPDVLYHPDMLGTYQEAYDTAGRAYVALTLAGHELIEGRDVTIGSGGTSVCGSNDSRRKRRQTTRRHEGENGPLAPSTKYTAFMRAYAVLEDRTEDYVTSDLLQPIYTANAQTDNATVIAVVSVVGTAFTIVLIACGVRMWRKTRTAKNNRPKRTIVEMDEVDYEKTVPENGIASTVYEDIGLPSWALRWEIKWKNMVVDDKVLGQGNFGEVRSGTVNIGGKMTKTAVKVLKGQASKTDRDDFMEEFRTMTSIGYHPNVVSLLGACQNEDVLYVALEFLPNGDLRSYLRIGRLESSSGEGALSSDQLIEFALDVAKGMKHLAMSGVIHRDLAARNILLGKGLVAKVSDFGLSRGEDIYVQTSMRRVPTRWLSIESLMYRTYTTQSDVWSFGILLWEIASIGGTPYPSIATKSLAAQLMDGYRMSKPPNCNDEIYSLMLRCWEEDPSNRPTFSDLVRILREMDDNKTENIYMAIDRAHYENFSVIRPELDDN